METFSILMLVIFLLLGLMYVLFRFISKIFPSAKLFSDGIVTIMTGTSILSACLISFLLFFSFLNLFPKYTFYDTFKFAAPEDVTELKTSRTIIGNNVAWLQFRAGKQTISKILTEDFSQSDDFKHLPDVPNFVDFANTHEARVYENSRDVGKYDLQKKWIAYDEKTGEIFYYQVSLNAENYY